jgi:cation diffusion facilitator CzcD-associated flavoprotein CzcO
MLRYGTGLLGARDSPRLSLFPCSLAPAPLGRPPPPLLARLSPRATPSLSRLAAAMDICVIGAGAAGLVVAKELREHGTKETAFPTPPPPHLSPSFESLSLTLSQSYRLQPTGHSVTVYEQSGNVGGVWAFDPRQESDPLGSDPSRSRVHSSMYASLRTNLPRELMGYRCFPFDTLFSGSGDARRFCGHEEVQRYLEAFADHYSLREMVRLGVRVEACAPLLLEGEEEGAQEAAAERGREQRGDAAGPAGPSPAAAAAAASDPRRLWGPRRWRVVTRPASPHTAAHQASNLGSTAAAEAGTAAAAAAVEEKEYDAVVVCNGHYSEPRLPPVSRPPGPGPLPPPTREEHSHNYRTCEPYIGKTVVIVGAMSSGEDIARELADGGAKTVYLSARAWQSPTWGTREAQDQPLGKRGNLYRRAMLAAVGLPGGRVRFEDGRETEEGVDVVMYCTGYHYSFPFLATPLLSYTSGGSDSQKKGGANGGGAGGVNGDSSPAAAAASSSSSASTFDSVPLAGGLVHVADNRVGPLYEHVFPPAAPTLAFVGLP